MKTNSIRGAITVENNVESDIILATNELLKKMLLDNNINFSDVISIFFSASEDLDRVYPAKAAREMGFVDCGLMCFQEMKVHNSLEKCIRIMILVNGNTSQSEIKHVYLKDAVNLRPDITRL